MISPQQTNSAPAPVINSVRDLIIALRNGCQLEQPAYSHHFRLTRAGKPIAFDEKYAIAAFRAQIVAQVAAAKDDGAVLYKLTTRAGGAQE